MLLVGKNATSDGSVLMAYSNDWDGRGASHVIVVPRKKHKPGDTCRLSNGEEIPQPEITYAYLGNELLWTDFPTFENGINEYQVAICFGTAVRTSDKAKKVDPILNRKSKKPGILIPWRIVLERARTAREGVKIVEELFNKYGLAEDGSFAIADPNEIWLFQIGGGHHWAAMRVPDDSYLIQDNTFRMGEINCEDEENFRCSPHLVPFSIEKGLYEAGKGPFNFKKAWGHVYTKIPPSDRRIWRVQSLLSPSTALPPETQYFDFPLCLKPEKKITKEMLMFIMRDHYEGTELDHTDNYKKENPHFTKERTLCRTNTQYTVIFQLRGWLPNEIGGVFWLALANPCTSVFVPWYSGIQETPQVYQVGNGTSDPQSAYWSFKRIGNLVNTNYQELIGDTKKTWESLEKRELAFEETIEKVALELYQKDRDLCLDFLTNYSNSCALEVYQKAQKMINELQTKLVKLHYREIEK